MAFSMNWTELNDKLRDCSEHEAKALLDYERKHERRTQWLMRIHARYNRLRGQRERAELLGEAPTTS